MDIRDRATLAQWLQSGATMADVESVARIGLVGNARFSETARRAFRIIWEWSAPRFAGRIGAKQDELFNRHGAAFLARRFERCRAIAARITGIPRA
jgi:hypothetical protein